LIGKLIQVATAIAKKFAGQLGVAEEAIGPFPVETCSTMLVTAEGLVNQAKAKLADADIFTV
jgi:pyruvate kinase